jgi:hypothetical protein
MTYQIKGLTGPLGISSAIAPIRKGDVPAAMRRSLIIALFFSETLELTMD